MKKLSYNDLVFINCPFDNEYKPLFRAIVYAVYRCGFTPVSALVEDNATVNRIDKIYRIIEKCRYGIHDISRTELNSNSLPRFNMPFELGVFFAARRYGKSRQKNKNAIIFEKIKFLYQQYLSDINGVDTKSHNNDPLLIIDSIRNWLGATSKRKLPGSDAMIEEFKEFLKHLPTYSLYQGFPDVDKVPFNDFCTMVEEAIRAKLFRR